MKRLYRKGIRIPFAVIIVFVAILAVVASGWANERDNSQRAWSLAVNSMGAAAIALSGRQYEAQKVGEVDGENVVLQKKLETARGKWGAYRRLYEEAKIKMCEKERLLDKYRGAGWRSEIPCEVKK